MRFQLSHLLKTYWFLTSLFALFAGNIQAAELPPKPAEYQLTNGELDTVGQAVVELLQTKDAERFATNLSVSASDWHSLIATNMAAAQVDRLNTYAKGSDYNIKRLKSDAESILARADALHLDFSKGNWQSQVVTPKHVGGIYLGNPSEGGATEPYVQTLEIVLQPAGTSDSSTNGDFKLAIRGLEKFPTGWRIFNGLQWKSFPANIMDAKTAHELAMLDKIANYKPISNDDDPMLSQLSETLIHFIRTGDTNRYQKEAFINADLIWSQVQKKSGGKGPSRAELDSQIQPMFQQQAGLARALLKQMDDAGIVLSNAEIQIKSTTVEHCQPQGGNSLDGLTGEQFQLSFSVKSAGKSRNGTSLTGDYVIGADEVMRFGDGWRVARNIRWQAFPPGVIDAAAEKKLAFENYVAEYHTLPRQMAAPEIEFTTLAGDKKMKLSDLHGKVVLLDFWATWCGPCQQPMADLQKIRQPHADWGDKVAIVPVSIDDTMDIVRKHIDQRGWTNTFNVWAGDGGWESATAQTFRVTQVPTTYILDAEGKIIYAGYPDDSGLAQTIDGLLK